MQTVPLTLQSTYVPHWGTDEGLRELIQNWMDEEDESGTPGEITHDGERLTLYNHGSSIPLAALLIGHTSKAGVAEQRGEHGEGLDVGALALVRAGHGVRVECGSSRWDMAIAPHPTLGADVLTVEISDCPEVGGVRVTVGGVTPGQYSDARARFRRFSSMASVEHGHYGEMLTDESQQGRVFVKGIWVCDVDKMRFGYDFANVQVDRDRRLVSGWNIAWHAGGLVAAALSGGMVDAQLVYDMADDDTKDSGQIHSHIGKAGAEPIAELFRGRHGASAIPCERSHEAEDLAGIGIRGVVVSDSLRQIVEKVTGTASDALADAVRAPTKTYGIHELTDGERAALLWAVTELRAIGLAVPHVNVSDFRRRSTMGQFRGGDIYAARWVLACRYATLTTVLHEVGHFVGSHGAAHNGATENAWTELAARWHNDTAADFSDRAADKANADTEDLPF